MVTITRVERLSPPIAPILAAAGGALIFVVFLAMPTSRLEALVAASGIARFIAAAEPPLGFTARIALGLMFGGGFAAASWLVLTVSDGGRIKALGQRVRPLEGAAGMLRRADIHPDAPPRPPLRAGRDLGDPFPPADEWQPDEWLTAPFPAEWEAEATDKPAVEPVVSAPPPERPLPRDLDQPMAAFDPDAVPDTPLPPPTPAARERRALIDPGDRIETFELTPVSRPMPFLAQAQLAQSPLAQSPLAQSPVQPVAEGDPAEVVAARTEATVHDLLARLERGIAGRGVAVASAPAGSLQNTLGDLRRMAIGG